MSKISFLTIIFLLIATLATAQQEDACLKITASSECDQTTNCEWDKVSGKCIFVEGAPAAVKSVSKDCSTESTSACATFANCWLDNDYAYDSKFSRKPVCREKTFDCSDYSPISKHTVVEKGEKGATETTYACIEDPMKISSEKGKACEIYQSYCLPNTKSASDVSLFIDEIPASVTGVEALDALFPVKSEEREKYSKDLMENGFSETDVSKTISAMNEYIKLNFKPSDFQLNFCNAKGQLELQLGKILVDYNFIYFVSKADKNSVELKVFSNPTHASGFMVKNQFYDFRNEIRAIDLNAYVKKVNDRLEEIYKKPVKTLTLDSSNRFVIENGLRLILYPVSPNYKANSPCVTIYPILPSVVFKRLNLDEIKDASQRIFSTATEPVQLYKIKVNRPVDLFQVDMRKEVFDDFSFAGMTKLLEKPTEQLQKLKGTTSDSLISLEPKVVYDFKQGELARTVADAKAEGSGTLFALVHLSDNDYYVLGEKSNIVSQASKYYAGVGGILDESNSAKILQNIKTEWEKVKSKQGDIAAGWPVIELQGRKLQGIEQIKIRLTAASKGLDKNSVEKIQAIIRQIDSSKQISDEINLAIANELGQEALENIVFDTGTVYGCLKEFEAKKALGIKDFSYGSKIFVPSITETLASCGGLLAKGAGFPEVYKATYSENGKRVEEVVESGNLFYIFLKVAKGEIKDLKYGVTNDPKDIAKFKSDAYNRLRLNYLNSLVGGKEGRLSNGVFTEVFKIIPKSLVNPLASVDVASKQQAVEFVGGSTFSDFANVGQLKSKDGKFELIDAERKRFSVEVEMASGSSDGVKEISAFLTLKQGAAAVAYDFSGKNGAFVSTSPSAENGFYRLMVKDSKSAKESPFFVYKNYLLSISFNDTSDEYVLTFAPLAKTPILESREVVSKEFDALLTYKVKNVEKTDALPNVDPKSRNDYDVQGSSRFLNKYDGEIKKFNAEDLAEFTLKYDLKGFGLLKIVISRIDSKGTRTEVHCESNSPARTIVGHVKKDKNPVISLEGIKVTDDATGKQPCSLPFDEKSTYVFRLFIEEDNLVVGEKVFKVFGNSELRSNVPNPTIVIKLCSGAKEDTCVADISAAEKVDYDGSKIHYTRGSETYAGTNFIIKYEFDPEDRSPATRNVKLSVNDVEKFDFDYKSKFNWDVKQRGAISWWPSKDAFNKESNEFKIEVFNTVGSGTKALNIIAVNKASNTFDLIDKQQELEKKLPTAKTEAERQTIQKQIDSLGKQLDEVQVREEKVVQTQQKSQAAGVSKTASVSRQVKRAGSYVPTTSSYSTRPVVQTPAKVTTSKTTTSTSKQVKPITTNKVVIPKGATLEQYRKRVTAMKKQFDSVSKEVRPMLSACYRKYSSVYTGQCSSFESKISRAQNYYNRATDAYNGASKVLRK